MGLLNGASVAIDRSNFKAVNTPGVKPLIAAIRA
jgi:hypothetical protein